MKLLAPQAAAVDTRGRMRAARRALGFSATLVLLSSACDQNVLAPTPSPGDAKAFSSISDASRDGNAHFFWLPPLVRSPRYGGVFDATLAPVVRVSECSVASCDGSVVAEFTTTSGSGPERLRVDRDAEHYIVNWRTRGLSADVTYRIRVLVAGTELGHADVDVVASGRQLEDVDTENFIPVLEGRTLPIKFRIEQGAVFVVGAAGGTVSAFGGTVTLDVPPDALDHDVGITVARISNPTSDVGVLDGTLVDLGPTGTTFAKPVRLEIGYDPTLIPGSASESELTLLTLDVAANVWRDLPNSSADPATHTASGQIIHFSGQGVGLRQVTLSLTPGLPQVVVGSDVQFTATASPATSRHIRFRSSNTSVATVGLTDGLAHAVAPGTAEITASCEPRCTSASATMRVLQALDEVIGTSTVSIPRADVCGRPDGRQCESLIGDVTTDAMRTTYGVDFALFNSGAIRSSLTCPTGDPPAPFCPVFTPPPYPVTRGQVFAVFPFGNRVVTVSITGAELKTMLENGVSPINSPVHDGRFAQVSGLCLTYDPDLPTGSRVMRVLRQAGDGTCSDTEIDLSAGASYTIAQTDFTATGGDGYPNMEGRFTVRDFVDQVVADYVAAHSPLTPVIQGRITCTSTFGPCPTPSP